MINILFFASLRDQMGADSMQIDTAPMSVAQLKTHMSQHHGLTNCEAMAVSINQVYAKDSDVINAGDTVAFIPPVGGG